MDEVRKREVREQLSRDPRRALLMLTEVAASAGVQDPEVPYLVGVAHFRLGEFSSARSALSTAIAMKPQNPDAFYYLGLSAERQGRNEDAVKAYRTAASLNPGLRKAHEKLRHLDSQAEPDRRSQRSTPFRSPAPPRGGSPPPPPPPPPRPRESQLMLPNTEEEFADYERRRRRKETIDARVTNAAQISGLPGAAKVFLVIILILIAAFFLFWLVGASGAGFFGV